jgi:hypothetical protein
MLALDDHQIFVRDVDLDRGSRAVDRRRRTVDCGLSTADCDCRLFGLLATAVSSVAAASRFIVCRTRKTWVPVVSTPVACSRVSCRPLLFPSEQQVMKCPVAEKVSVLSVTSNVTGG